MKKTLFILLLSCFCSALFAQNGLLIGAEGSAKYASRQSPTFLQAYQIKAGFDVGISLSQRIKNSGIFWHTGLFYNQFREEFKDNNIYEIIENQQLKNISQIFSKHSLQVPVGAKIYFSDRKCMMFVHPQLVFDYFFQEKESIHYYNNVEGSDSFRFTNRQSLVNQSEYLLSGGLAIGGKQPIAERIYLMIQLEGRYGFWGTSDFTSSQPWSLGIRASVLHELF